MKITAARVTHIFCIVVLLLVSPCRPLLAQEWKRSVRGLFGEISQAVSSQDVGSLPAGIHAVHRSGISGIVIEPGMAEVFPHAWNGAPGLLDRYREAAVADRGLVAAINGTFFGTQGVLGQLVIGRKRPRGIRQMPASFSRCFLALLSGTGGSRWVLGETAVHGDTLCQPEFFTTSRFNRPIQEGERLEHLLGGGGWIVRDGRDVHMEAYGRQKFRFRKADQDSRHTIVAMDRQNRLYLLIAETGSNLERVSSLLRDPTAFDSITDAIFFDGGSSSVLIANGQYLVAPLYLVDKARYSALFVRVPAPDGSVTP
ncbi:MAG TPA: phosphodiester glycosidase family protein [Candidatus Ozemobacteraceae bacterium]|nr:phosphodiester glycosidase family protein [Candidatus Ozemobacteraceae bacterium]